MSTIRKIDTINVKNPLDIGEFGLDMVPGGDEGRVYIGTGIENIPLARLDEIEVPVEEEAVVGQTTVSVADSANMLLRIDGVVQVEGIDYTITDATTIELVVPLLGTEIVSVLTITDILDILASKYNIPLGMVQLDGSGLVSAAQLPSYVDDVIEVATYADLPVTGEGGKIYVVVADETSNGDTSSYRWTGSVYAIVSNTLTATDIEALYEGLANTNKYTDAEKSKLADVEVAQATYINKTLDDYTNKIKANAVHMRVKNQSGAVMAKGTVISYFGYSDTEDAVKVVKASNTAGVAIGILAEELAVGAFGMAIADGIVDGLDTSMYTNGTILYTDTLGGLTDVEPTTGLAQPIAYVLKSNATIGVLQVLAAYPKQDANDVRVAPQGNLSSNTVQLALEELDDEITSLTTAVEW